MCYTPLIVARAVAKGHDPGAVPFYLWGWFAPWQIISAYGKGRQV